MRRVLEIVLPCEPDFVLIHVYQSSVREYCCSLLFPPRCKTTRKQHLLCCLDNNIKKIELARRVCVSDKSAGSEPVAFVCGLVAFRIRGLVAPGGRVAFCASCVSDKSAGSEPAARGLVAPNPGGRVALFFHVSDKSAGSEPAAFGLVAPNPGGRVALFLFKMKCLGLRLHTRAQGRMRVQIWINR